MTSARHEFGHLAEALILLPPGGHYTIFLGQLSWWFVLTMTGEIGGDWIAGTRKKNTSAAIPRYPIRIRIRIRIWIWID